MSRIKILIVEDELIISQDISFKLEDLGYEVVEMASDYEEAIEIIEAEALDIVLLDINLSEEKDGIDVAKYIRANKDLPFVYLTSNADFSTVSRAKETKPNGYVLKPVQTKELLVAIEMALASVTGVATNQKPITKEHLFVHHKDALVKISQKDILYLQADGNYTKILTVGQRYMVRGNIKETQKNLGDTFCRVHKSYVVNLNHIDKIKATTLEVNEIEIPIGKSFKEDLLNRIKKI